MRRLGLIAAATAAITGALVMAPAAGAWTLPSNAGAGPGGSVASYCPSFPADPSQPAAVSAGSGTVTLGSGSWTYSPAVAVTAGLYEVGYVGSTVAVEVEAQNAAGGWEVVGYEPAGQPSMQLQLPAGNVRVGGLLSSGSVAVPYFVVPVASLPLGADAGQYAAVACLNAASAAGQAHSDSAAVLAELQTVDADVRAQGSGGGASGPVVQLSAADRQLLADASTGAHDDLWLLAGGLLGVWMAWVVVKAVWL